MASAFIQAHREKIGARDVPGAAGPFSDFYAWLIEPLSNRAREDARETELIRQAWAESAKVYGYRKLTDDLRDLRYPDSNSRIRAFPG